MTFRLDSERHPSSGMISYFLPLEAGARKVWGSPTYDFWCCHGTLVLLGLLGLARALAGKLYTYPLLGGFQ